MKENILIFYLPRHLFGCLAPSLLINCCEDGLLMLLNFFLFVVIVS